MRMFASATTILLYPPPRSSVCSLAKLPLMPFSSSQLDLARSSHPRSDDREDCKQKNQGAAALHGLCVSMGCTANAFQRVVLTWVSAEGTVTFLDDFEKEPAQILEHIKD